MQSYRAGNKTKINIECSESATAPGAADGDELRCVCARLLARVVVGGIELKCRRCRRIVVVPLADDSAA